MQGWTDDLSIPLPPGRTVTDLADFILKSAVGGTPGEQIDRSVAVGFGLSEDDAEFARDRTFGGLVRAATGHASNCPPRDKDPVAWESFQRGIRDPALIAHIYPEFAPEQ